MIDSDLVARLRGAPLAVLCSLLFYGPQDVADLVVSTGYGRSTVLKGTAVLVAVGYIEREHYRAKWKLSTGFTQLPLIGLESPKSKLLDAESPKSKLSRPLDSSSSTTTRDREIRDLLAAYGVREPALSRLCRLSHVSAELVTGHFDSAETTGQAIYRIKHNWSVPKRPARDVPCEYQDIVYK